MILHIAVWIYIPWLVSVAFAQQNVTVDDTDTSIVYSPANAWILSANSSLDLGGAHMLTENPNATATFKFIGTAIYFLSPKWPYTVNTAVSLDGGASILIDLVDPSRPRTTQGPETLPFAVVWSATGLNNTQHTLVISVGAGQPFGIVDGLMYTTAAYSSTTSSSSSSISSQSPTSSTSAVVPVAPPSESQTSAAKKIHVGPFIIGSIFGLIGVFVVALALYFAFKRKRRPTSEAWTVDGTQFSEPSSTSTLYPLVKGSVRAQSPPSNGAWHNSSRYGHEVSPTPATTPPPMDDPSRAPNRYQPGFTLSTITEKSTPRIGEAHASLAGSPGSTQSSELPSGYYTAPGSEVDGISATLDAAQGGLPRYSVRASPQGPPPGWI